MAQRRSQSAQPSEVFKSMAGPTVVGGCAAAGFSGAECRLAPPCRAPGADRPSGPVGGMENQGVPPGPYRATRLVRPRVNETGQSG